MSMRVLLVLLFAVTVSSAGPEGIVNRVKGEYVLLSLGMLDGIKVGDRLLIYRSESFAHPLTGERIEIPRLKVAEVTVTDVGNLFSESVLTEIEMPVRKGDRVGLTGEEKDSQKVLTDTGKTTAQPDTMVSPPRVHTAEMTISPPSSTPKTHSRSLSSRSGVKKRYPSVRRTRPPVTRRTPAVESTDSTSVSPSTEEPKSVTEQEFDTRYESASAVLKQAGKKNDPSRIDAHFWVGQRYYRMKNYAKAAEHFSTVVEAGGNSSKRNTALFNLAMCYYEMHKGEPAELDQAKQTFQKVRDNFPNTPSAVQAAGWIETIEWLQRVGQEQRQKQQTAPEDSGGQQESAAKMIKGKQH